jgi:hypothetical protein
MTALGTGTLRLEENAGRDARKSRGTGKVEFLRGQGRIAEAEEIEARIAGDAGPVPPAG